MKIVIRNATIVCHNSPFHLQAKDIFIDNNVVSRIADHIDEQFDELIEGNDLHVSVGWVDMFCFAGEPGFEHRETLETCARAASAGGYTGVMVVPDTRPVSDNKAQVNFIKEKTNAFPVNFHSIGAVTKNCEGKELAEMYDMNSEGAVAFSDGWHPLQDVALTLRALQYLASINKVLIQIPKEKSLFSHGLMHEGIVSTQLGLPGIPAMAEHLAITRDIAAAKYTSGTIHITGVSTADGVDLIRKAKADGVNISCSVTPYHLYFTDEHLRSYDTNLKVSPPLRTEADRQALIAAVEDGTIDAVASHHYPQHIDNKQCEFEYAYPGMITLQYVFGIINKIVGTERAVRLLTYASSIFNINKNTITEGMAADLTIFSPSEKTNTSASAILSLSQNSPFTDQELKGRVVGTFCKGKLNRYEKA